MSRIAGQIALKMNNAALTGSGRAARVAVQALVVALIVTNAGLAATSDAAPRNCVARGSRTIFATPQVRIFQLRKTTYGCLYRRGRRVALPGFTRYQTETDSVGGYRLRLAGRFVAYALGASGREGLSAAVVLVDLQSGKWSSPSGDKGGQSGNLSYSVPALLVRSNGSLGWIFRIDESNFENGRVVTTTTYEVRKFDEEKQTLLDTGPDIDPTSLALGGARIYWMKAGTAFSTVLN